MIHSKRVAVAFIIGKFISNPEASTIYDFKSSAHYNFGGEVSKSSVSVYDFKRSSQIGGTIESLYDFETSQHISLNIDSQEFSGYDFESGYHFSGNCNTGSISFYDFESSEFYNFSM